MLVNTWCYKSLVRIHLLEIQVVQTYAATPISNALYLIAIMKMGLKYLRQQYPQQLNPWLSPLKLGIMSLLKISDIKMNSSICLRIVVQIRSLTKLTLQRLQLHLKQHAITTVKLVGHLINHIASPAMNLIQDTIQLPNILSTFI